MKIFLYILMVFVFQSRSADAQTVEDSIAGKYYQFKQPPSLEKMNAIDSSRTDDAPMAILTIPTPILILDTNKNVILVTELYLGIGHPDIVKYYGKWKMSGDTLLITITAFTMAPSGNKVVFARVATEAETDITPPATEKFLRNKYSLVQIGGGEKIFNKESSN